MEATTKKSLPCGCAEYPGGFGLNPNCYQHRVKFESVGVEARQSREQAALKSQLSEMEGAKR